MQTDSQKKILRKKINELIDTVQRFNLPSEWAIFQVKITSRCGM
jgi:hypothetical protein